MSKYNYNKDYFKKIDSAEKAYWLGFLYADGCITRFYKGDEIRSMSLEISLAIKDKEHLVKFNKAIDSNVPIKCRDISLNGKKHGSCRLVINCTKMCYDLINLGCTPHKTFDIKFPTNDIVPDEYIKFWMEGFFDGDGCICIPESTGKSRMIVNITGIEPMLKSIGSFLVNNEIITKTPIIHRRNGSNACGIFLYGNNMKRFLDYIYQDTNIYLTRKYNKYKDFFKDYDKIDINGVYLDKNQNIYIVTICIDGKKITVGRTKDIDEAIEMRKQAEIAKFNNSPLNQ